MKDIKYSVADQGICKEVAKLGGNEAKMGSFFRDEAANHSIPNKGS